MRNKSADTARIDAVDRAMRLLRLLQDRGELGVTEGAAELGVAPSTVHRLLTTMAAHGFVTQLASRRYRPGELLADPGEPRNRNALLAATLRRVAERLFAAVGETVHVMVLAGSDIQFIDGIEGGQALRIGLRIGGRLPAHCTSGGKAMLAEFDAKYIATLYANGLPRWPGARVHTIEELHTELTEAQARGVAFNRGESELGVRALGVAVGPEGSQPLAALTVSLPTERFERADQRGLVDALITAKREAAALL